MPPLLIYDGKCSFCIACVRYLRARTGGAVEYSPFQKGESVEYVTPDGEVYRGARAIFEALAAGGSPWWRWAYRRVPGFAPAAEAVYRFVAKRRRCRSVCAAPQQAQPQQRGAHDRERGRLRRTG